PFCTLEMRASLVEGAGENGHHSRRNSQDHHADESYGACVSVRTQVRMRERLMGQCSVVWEERHHAAGDEQPDIRCANELESTIRLRWPPEHPDLDRQQH